MRGFSKLKNNLKYQVVVVEEEGLIVILLNVKKKKNRGVRATAWAQRTAVVVIVASSLRTQQQPWVCGWRTGVPGTPPQWHAFGDLAWPAMLWRGSGRGRGLR